MLLFQPKRVFIEEDALKYPLGIEIIDKMSALDVPIQMIGSHNRVTGIPGTNPQQCYHEGKQTLVVGVKRDLKFDTCKPSADFEFSIATGCPGGCQYCYLQTQLGKKPYIRVYVNLESIFAQIEKVVNQNLPKTTTFEAASTSDPLAVEHITGSLAKTIRFFGELENARLRVVTKFDNVESLLPLPHRQHTRFRFSLNTAPVIQQYEQHTASAAERITAAGQIAAAGYPLGFIIAPLFMYPNFAQDYETLFQQLAETLVPSPADLHFELISHRFTPSAKRVILERFPNTQLDLDESKRRRKFGRYGLVKYIYSESEMINLKTTLTDLVNQYFPNAVIDYFT